MTVNDNDTARVTGLTVTPGNAQLAVNWTAVDNATGYKVQWKSGSQGYNTGSRQSTVTSGSTTSHTITGLANGTEYTVRVSATRTGANDGPASAEKHGHAGRVDRAGRHGVDDGADGDGAGLDRGRLHRDAGYRADGECRGDGRRALGHRRDREPDHPDVHEHDLEHRADGDGDRGRRCGHRRTIRSR